MSCISSTNSTFHNLRHGQCKGKVLLRGYLALFISRVQRDFTKQTDNQHLVFFKNLTKWKGKCLERSPPFLLFLHWLDPSFSKQYLENRLMSSNIL